MTSARHRAESALLRVVVSGKDGDDLTNEIEAEILRAEAELMACGNVRSVATVPSCNDGVGCIACWRTYATKLAEVSASSKWCGEHGVSGKLCGECVQERADFLGLERDAVGAYAIELLIEDL